MGSICLSSAPILRCSSLTRTQSIVFVIPVALEVIATSSLVFLKWRSGNRHLLLTAEGWFYLSLALLELFSNILPSVRERLSLFRAFDVGIGVASFLPLFFYTFFLYLFTKSELIETLPNAIRNVAKLTLISFVPAIAISNEIASFVGVSIRNSLAPSSPDSVIVVGFTSKQQEGLWTFFTSLTLALLVVSQATVFCFAFFRITQGLLHQRRLQRRGERADGLVDGTSWVAGAMKLGAIEAVIGFAGGAFGVILARRIMRSISRICLTIGLAKGVKVIEDFEAIRSSSITKRPKSFRRSDLRQFISNPRYSTFRQMSPSATNFHSPPRAPHYVLKRDIIVSEKVKSRDLLSEKGGLPGMDIFANVKASRQKDPNRERVTVFYNNGAPSLHMRFSELNIPSIAVISRSIKKSDPDWDLFSSRTATVSSKGDAAEAYAKLEGGLVPPQRPRARTSAQPTETTRDSIISAPEIIAGPRHIIKPARAAMVNASAAASRPSLVASESPTLQPNSAPLGLGHNLSQRSRRATTATGRSRSDSVPLTIRSGTDSIQAVRELAPQFPGPPLLSSGRVSWMGGNSPIPRGTDRPQLVEANRAQGSPPGLTYWDDSSSVHQEQHARQSSLSLVTTDVAREDKDDGTTNDNKDNNGQSSNGSNKTNSPVVFASTSLIIGRNGNNLYGGGGGTAPSSWRVSEAPTMVPSANLVSPKVEDNNRDTISLLRVTNPSDSAPPSSSFPVSPDSVIDPYRNDTVGREHVASVRATRATRASSHPRHSTSITPSSPSIAPALPHPPYHRHQGHQGLVSRPSVSTSAPQTTPGVPTIFTAFTLRTPTTGITDNDVVTVTPATDVDFLDMGVPGTAKSLGVPSSAATRPPGSAFGAGSRQAASGGSGNVSDLSRSHRSSLASGNGSGVGGGVISPDSEKREMISRWVDDTNHSTAASGSGPLTAPISPPANRMGVSTANLHERGKSIDNLSIRWGGASSRIKKDSISRVKTVGMVAQRSTPPVQAGHMVRGSLHLEPLTIPPPAANRPIVVQGIAEVAEGEAEYGSPDSASGKNVLRDADVLEMQR